MAEISRGEHQGVPSIEVEFDEDMEAAFKDFQLGVIRALSEGQPSEKKQEFVFQWIDKNGDDLRRWVASDEGIKREIREHGDRYDVVKNEAIERFGGSF